MEWFTQGQWRILLENSKYYHKPTSHIFVHAVDTERGVNQYQVQFKTFFNLYLNHSTISNEQ
jgi:hypothetical protein